MYMIMLLQNADFCERDFRIGCLQKKNVTLYSGFTVSRKSQACSLSSHTFNFVQAYAHAYLTHYQ